MGKGGKSKAVRSSSSHSRAGGYFGKIDGSHLGMMSIIMTMLSGHVHHIDSEMKRLLPDYAPFDFEGYKKENVDRFEM